MTTRTRIKICGVSRDEDVAGAVDSGADAVGFVFHPTSPRCVTVAQAARLAKALPPFVTPVGLFVDAPRAEIEAALAAIGPLMLQFHGNESPEACASFGRPFVKVARMTPELDILTHSRRFHRASALVLDAHVDSFGGGGALFDWTLVPKGLDQRLILSGGLNERNVGSGIAAIRPWAVDVSSGVESSRGVKDIAAIRRFCDAVREADARIEASAS